MNLKAKLGLSFLLAFSVLVLLAVATLTPSRTGALAATGIPVAARFSHTATLLANGKVLVAGGLARNGVWLDSTEVWDPVSERFSPGSRMSSRRAGATATLLPSGQVLIAGGGDGSAKNLATAELYDPLTQSFMRTGDMTVPRSHAVAVLLQSGKVLIAGGNAAGDNEELASAEIYDPETGKFMATGAMHVPRSYTTAVALNDGRVLIAGGLSGGEYPNHRVEASAEIYDPVRQRFVLTGSMAARRYKQGSALLPDGRVLVAGGSDEDGRQNRYSSTEIFDPQTGRFSAGPDMKFHRYKLLSGVATLNDGRVLVAGGAEQPEIYDPVRNTFTLLKGEPLEGFLFSTATPLRDGRVLLIDGYGRHPAAGAVRQARMYVP